MPSYASSLQALTCRQRFRAGWLLVWLVGAIGGLTAGEPGEEPENLLWILATGEIHATPDPCDCPLNPLGGLGQLAGRLQAEAARHPDRTVTIDTGAFVAGGPLDSRSAGSVADRERSRWMLRFLSLARYDAVALGDEELLLGRGFWAAAAAAGKDEQPADSPFHPTLPRLPITCANLQLTAAERKILNIAETIQVVTSAGHLWVVGLAPPGEYSAGEDRLVAGDPLPVVRALAQAAAADPLQPKLVLASHLGDAETFDLLDQLPADLASRVAAVVAGHRRPADVRRSIQQIPVLFVRGEGQYLSRMEFGRAAFPRLDELPVAVAGPNLPSAAAVADRIRALTRQARPQVDFTFATDCPHCTAALEPALATIERFGSRVDFHLRFMVHRNADGRYLTGIQPGPAAEQRSYEETRRLLIVAKYAPPDVWKLMKWRKNNPTAELTDGLAAIGFPAWRLNRALEAGEDRVLLDENLALTERRRVPGTPAVYLDNRRYEGALQILPLQSALCAHLRKRSGVDAAGELETLCAGVPRCYQDGDCEKPGCIARCLDAGLATAECQFIEDREVTLWVVRDPQALHSNAADLIGQLGKFFAKLKVEAVDADSDLGRQIIARSEQTTLPVYAVKNLRDAVNQADVEKFGRYVGDSFVLQPLPFYSHDHFTRKRVPGTLDVFYETHSPNAAKAILRLNNTLAMLAAQYPGKPTPIVRLHPLVYLKPADPERMQPEKLIARGGLGELEQSARLVAVAAAHPDQVLAYAALCAQAPGTTYWDRPLKALRIDPEPIAAQAAAEEVTAQLRAEAALAQMLRVDGDIAFLARNRELIPIQNGEQLWKVLEQLQADREPQRPPEQPHVEPNLPFTPTFRGGRP